MRVKQSTPHPARRQRGAVAVIVGFTIVVLMLMAGLVIDLGHLYVVRTELQNAADACALAAARELNDTSGGALDRATAAGITVGNRNRFDMQSEAVAVVAADVTFAETINGSYTRAVTTDTMYARCSPHQTNVRSVAAWVMQFVGYTDWPMTATATAKMVGPGPTCALPLAMCSATGSMSDFVKGRWYKGRLGSGTATSGNYDWIRFEGQGSSDLSDVIAGAGVCNISIPQKLDAEPGVSTSVAHAWNTRFGLYAGKYKKDDISLYPPDKTGYAFTEDWINSKGQVIPGSWPNLLTSPTPPLAPAASWPLRTTATVSSYDKTGTFAISGNWTNGTYDSNYLKHRDNYDIYDGRAIRDDKGNIDALPGNPVPITSGDHRTYGKADRRIVLVPVMKCSDWAPSKKGLDVIDYACAFMIRPLNDPNTDVKLEYRGSWLAGDCGGKKPPADFGPPVPALVK